jgi:starvation-inducible outer membrane lipoprotein
MMKLLALTLVLLLAGCINPLAVLTGGKPSVAANVQAGKENTQQVVANQTRTEAGRDVVQQSSPVVAENIQEVTIQQTPLWMIILLILGWLLPSPNEIARWIRGLFRK